MQLNPYLMFDGTCAEAFAFYETLLGARIEAMLTYGETPMCADGPPEMRARIAHARLAVDGRILMGSDCQPGSASKQQGVSVHLGVDDAATAERVFSQLAADGTVCMPLEETFWAHAFGVVVDRFGTSWMVNCEKPQ